MALLFFPTEFCIPQILRPVRERDPSVTAASAAFAAACLQPSGVSVIIQWLF